MFKMKANSPTLLSGLAFLTLVTAPKGDKDFVNQFEKWNYREGANKVNILGTRSITGTLEKWGNDIFREGKNILMYQPQTLLPDYTGMTALSEALDDLLRDVNALKKRLEGLNERFDLINKAFVRKRLRMAPRTPVASAGRLSSFLQSRQVKITQPPLRPYPVKRRVYIRRRKVKI